MESTHETATLASVGDHPAAEAVAAIREVSRELGEVYEWLVLALDRAASNADPSADLWDVIAGASAVRQHANALADAAEDLRGSDEVRDDGKLCPVCHVALLQIRAPRPSLHGEVSDDTD